MDTFTYKGWRFDHPDIDAPEDDAGLVVNSHGAISMVKDDAVIRQAILLLLSTLPGERVMRPRYGCELRKLIFSPNDDTTAGLAIHYVRQALRFWEPRIEILRLDANKDSSASERLNITLEYRVKTTRRTGQLNVSMNLTEESV